jgi:energy-converting hydrogenase Eha subunit E
MSIDYSFFFFLLLALRMAIAAAFVVSASVVAERTGPVIGALVATLPISAGPTYVFLAFDHDAAFIAQGALTSLPMNSATILMSLAYVMLAQRQSMIVSTATALAVWLGFATLIRSVHWTLLSGVVANAVTFAICLPLLKRYRRARMPLITRRWYDVPLRAALVATLVATVTMLSGWVGPTISGVLAVFPTVFTSMMLILHPRIGGPATAAVLANGAYGMIGFTSAVAVLQVAALPLGSAAALSLALATCVFWNLGLWWFGRRKVAK